MTTQDTINYYANLLILQFSGKPKAYSTIQASVTPFVMDQLPITVQNAFNINTAIGVQLDSIGKYAGVTRSGNALDGTPITLNDSDFRMLIKIAVITNNAGSSLSFIQTLLSQFFPNGEILVFDYSNMRLSYMIDSSFVSDNLAQLFVTENLIPYPMGVGHSTVVHYTPLTQFFGFRTYDSPAHNANPFNTYDSYITTWPFMNYDLAV